MVDLNHLSDEEILKAAGGPQQQNYPSNNSDYSHISDEEIIRAANQPPQQSHSIGTKLLEGLKGGAIGALDTLKSYTEPTHAALQSMPNLPPGNPWMGGMSTKQVDTAAQKINQGADYLSQQTRQGSQDPSSFDTGRNIGYYATAYGPGGYGALRAAGKGVASLGRALFGTVDNEALNAMSTAGISNPSVLSASGSSGGQKLAALLGKIPLVGSKGKYLNQNEELKQGITNFSGDLKNYPENRSLYEQINSAVKEPVGFSKGRDAAQAALNSTVSHEYVGGTAPTELKNRLLNIINAKEGSFKDLQGATENLSNYVSTQSKSTAPSLTKDELNLLKQTAAAMRGDMGDIANKVGMGDVFKEANSIHKQKLASEYVEELLGKSQPGSTQDIHPISFIKKVQQDLLRGANSKLSGTLPPEEKLKLDALIKATQAMEWQLKSFKPGPGLSEGVTGTAAAAGAIGAGLLGHLPTAAAVGGAIKGISSFLNSKAGLKFAQMASNSSWKDPKMLAALGSLLPQFMGN